MVIVEKDVRKLASALPGMEKWITLPAETHCGCLNKPGGEIHGNEWILKPFHKMGTNCANFRCSAKVSAPMQTDCTAAAQVHESRAGPAHRLHRVCTLDQCVIVGIFEPWRSLWIQCSYHCNALSIAAAAAASGF